MEVARTALITGATGGIGQAIAVCLARQGYSLYLHYNQKEGEARRLGEQLRERFGCEPLLFQANLAEEEGSDTLAEALPVTPDIVVHAAGSAHYGLFADVSATDYQRMVQLHLTSPFLLTQLLAPAMISRRWGRVVFLTSIWGETGASCEALYSMVKSGLLGLTKALAKEWGPSGVTVNAVSPGLVDTAMNHSFTSEELISLYEEIPVGRMGTPEEVAHAVQFLLSDQSGYITGQVIRVNGGWYT